ncbi:MAG: STAS domain-containing protein [Solirubrobacterales bacterium]|nr:STAS domain-containing protein [Solirubrobacterales bacterium]
MAALPDFRIETLKSDSGITIKLGGELDSATCDELMSVFEQAVGQAGASPADAAGSPKVTLDLADVTFIDSSGLRAIVLIERSAGERGMAVTILPPPEALTDLLQIADTSDHVTLVPHGADAASTQPFLERIELELARVPGAPGRARAELRETFGERLQESDRGTATLLTSELVTNAVIHPDPGAGGSIGLRITAFADRLRVEVSDSGSGFVAGDLPPRPRETGGHGLLVVDGMSSRWGTRQGTADGEDGFCVWFELDTDYELSASADPPSTDPSESAERPAAAAEG